LLAVVPGEKSLVRNYWLFPIMVEKPDETIKELEKCALVY
jgi:hypothetical protein